MRCVSKKYQTTTYQKMSQKSKEYFEELPLHELLEINVNTLTAEEARTMLSVVQEQRTSPQKRRSKKSKESNRLTGKSAPISNMDDLLT